MSTWRPISKPPAFIRWLPERLHDPLMWAMRAAICAMVLVIAVVIFYLMLSSRYDLDEVAKLPAGIVICDRDGELIDAPGNSSHRLAKRREIPDFLVDALRAREDARFNDHHGVDTRGLIRATLRNIRDWNFTQGASTLTMQLARNSFDMREKSLHRKLLEIAIAMRIESRYSKDEILTHYLNRIYFGSGAYGIEQASQSYFGKTSADLSDSECALIVGIIRGPHVFSPLRNLYGATEQRDQTLARMQAMEMIDDERYNELRKELVTLADEEVRESQTSYALRTVRSELERIIDDEEALLSGLKVITTLDSAWQQRLERELKQSVEDLENENGWKHPTHHKHINGDSPNYLQFAAVTTETKTGGIMALIGGRNYSHSRYNRTYSKRDLGSAFEPFVAAAAAERGKLVLKGKPLKTGRQIGPSEVERIARRCGISGPFVETEDLFRGAVAASPKEMAIGLATLGNEGKRPKLYIIQEVRNTKGEVLYQAKPDLTQAITRDASLDAISVLQRKSGTRVFTGATASERDAWTLRLGPSGSTAIWIGFDQPKVIAKESRLKALLDEFVDRLGNN